MEQEHQPSGEGRALPTVTGEGGAEYPSLEGRRGVSESRAPLPQAQCRRASDRCHSESNVGSHWQRGPARRRSDGAQFLLNLRLSMPARKRHGPGRPESASRDLPAPTRTALVMVQARRLGPPRRRLGLGILTRSRRSLLCVRSTRSAADRHGSTRSPTRTRAHWHVRLFNPSDLK
jgi:hypothetical protein